jgi:CBS domain-containing protein/anti-sigma regulatory factor (Ser/Thr protein kinase)
MNEPSKLAKYASIFQDIRAADIMTANVVALPPDRKMSLAKEMMKVKKISGIPVVDEQKKLIGIVSIEDLINALQFNRMNEPIGNLMTRDVITIHVEETLSAVAEKFEQFKYGRFPVVDGENYLRGIISRKDILHGILEKFNLIYVHDQKRSSKLDSEFSIITGEKLKIADAEFHYDIDNSDIKAAGTGAAMLKQFLKGKQYPAEITRRVGVSTYEAETNVVIHSHGKGDIYCFLLEDLIMVRVVDSGVGIDDLEKAMKEGYSTAPDYVRELGFGAGMGIPNMRRFSDKLVILSEKNVGTQVEMIFYLPGQAVTPT